MANKLDFGGCVILVLVCIMLVCALAIYGGPVFAHIGDCAGTLMFSLIPGG